MKKRNLAAHGAPFAAGQFFGATRGQLRTGDFVVSAVTHASERVVPTHVHANPFLSMLISGSYREWFAGGHWDARTLGMVIRPPEAEHRDEIGPGGALFLCVDVGMDFWRAMAGSGVRLERRAFEDRPMSCTALRLLRELRERRPGWKAVAEALIVELVDDYLLPDRRAGRREPKWLARARDHLRSELPTASLTRLAAALDLHPVHVARVFKRHAGVTPSEYLRQQRLLGAARAVLESGDPLVAVAQRHGFADQSHLTREICRRTHWTPGGLRCACEHLR
ncbi:MAG: helix-turn-helix transcriptional regulator [Gammaproteobacteria bacterium]